MLFRNKQGNYFFPTFPSFISASSITTFSSPSSADERMTSSWALTHNTISKTSPRLFSTLKTFKRHSVFICSESFGRIFHVALLSLPTVLLIAYHAVTTNSSIPDIETTFLFHDTIGHCCSQTMTVSPFLTVNN